MSNTTPQADTAQPITFDTAGQEIQQVSDDDIRVAVHILVHACHTRAAAAGWWVNNEGRPIQDNPYCFSNKLMLVVSELAEAMEGDRKNLMDDKLPHRPMREVELCDALIRIFDMAGAFDMDLPGALMDKLNFNAIRPDHKIEARQAEGGKTY